MATSRLAGATRDLVSNQNQTDNPEQCRNTVSSVFFPITGAMQLLDSMGAVGLKGKRHLSAERAPEGLTPSAVAGKRGVLACLGTHSCPFHFPRHGIEKP